MIFSVTFCIKFPKKVFRKHDKAPFTFNCPNQCSYFKKYSQKCSHSNDFYCNVLKLTKEKNA